MRNRAALVLAVLVSAIFALFLVRNLPLLSNRDDFLRLYFGAYVGCAMLRGGAPAALIQRELAASSQAFGDELRASRFKVAQTPYSPLTLALVCAAEQARARLQPLDLPSWMLGVQTASWLALLAAAMGLVRWKLRDIPLTWFLAVGLSLVWMHVHTTPFLPSPRAIATLGTGLALALVLTGRSEPWAHGCAVLAGLSHPYNQVMGLAVALAFVLATAGSGAATGCRRRAAARIAFTAAVAVIAGLIVIGWANPRASLSADELWGYHQGAGIPNWIANRPAVYRLCLTVGLPLAALVYRYAGRRRAAAVATLFALMVALPAFLWPAGLYPGEMSNRVGGAWVAALFALCLRRDLLPDLSHIRPTLRAAGVASVLLVAGAGAVPEVLGIRNAPHYAPWLSPPRVEMLPGVERACLDIMTRTSRLPRPSGARDQGRTR